MDSESIPYEFNMRLLKFLQINIPIRKERKMLVSKYMIKRKRIKQSSRIKILNKNRNKLL
jgi:hypothetical protein